MQLKLVIEVEKELAQMCWQANTCLIDLDMFFMSKIVTKFIYYLAALVKLNSCDLNAKLFCNKSGT